MVMRRPLVVFKHAFGKDDVCKCLCIASFLHEVIFVSCSLQKMHYKKPVQFRFRFVRDYCTSTVVLLSGICFWHPMSFCARV